MPEIYPRITYSPEGVIELRRRVGDRDVPQEHLDRMLGPLESSDDYILEERGGEYVAQAHIPSMVPAGEYDSREANQHYLDIIGNLNLFTYAEPFDIRDYVFSLEFWNQYGATGIVYPHLQRWMNGGLLDEELGRQVFDAMSLPLDPNLRKLVEEDYKFALLGSDVSAGAGWMSVNAGLRQSEFRVSKLMEDDGSDASGYQSSGVKWRWPSLSTFGNCACWGVDGMDRSSIDLRPDMSRLYEMRPHNVDNATQSLSLVLGMGRLAFEAAQYEGEEDILAEVE